MAFQKAILGTARLGNFHLGDIDAALVGIRRTSVRIVIGGVEARTQVRVGSLTVHDGLNDTPNTATLIVQGTKPADVADLRISIGTDAPRLLFDGTMQTVDETYEGRPSQRVFPCTAIDNSARANRRRPFGRWTNVSATTVATYLIATFAPGFTSYHVEPLLPPISVTFDGSEGFNGCLRQIAKLIGGYFYFEDLDLHLFRSEPADTPDPIDALHPFLNDPPIHISRDFSQLRTRVYGRGLGAALLSDLAAGDTIVPIDDTASFNPAGGKAIAESQILAYTGRQLGGAGSAVGPGAAPANAPTVTAASGAGITDGAHEWAVSFVTASGESLVGPVAGLTAGLLAAPTAGPVIAAPTIAASLITGPDPGSHDYAVSFVTASGETLPSPLVTKATTLTPEPGDAPVPGIALVGPGPDTGYHDYAVSFVTVIGEMVAGPISAAVPTAPLPPPPTGPTISNPAEMPIAVDAGPHDYAIAFITAAGETVPGAATTRPADYAVAAPAPTVNSFLADAAGVPIGYHEWGVTFINPNGETDIVATSPITGTGTILPSGASPGQTDAPGSTLGYGAYRHAVTFYNASGETTPSPYGQHVNYPGYTSINVYLPFGPNGTIGRRIYRSAVNGTVLGLVATIANNTTSLWVDSVPDGSIGGPPPTVNTAASPGNFALTLPLGGGSVTARHLYRRDGGLGTYKLVAVISNNTTTFFIDSQPGVGSDAPTANTASITRSLVLSNIPIGPAGTTARLIYRTNPIYSGGPGGYTRISLLAGNVATTFTDLVPDSAPGTIGIASVYSGNFNTACTTAFASPTGPNFSTAASNATQSAAGYDAVALAFPGSTYASNASSIKNAYTSAATALTTVAGDPTNPAKVAAALSAVVAVQALVAAFSAGAPAPAVGSAPVNSIPLTDIPTGDNNVTARRLYRRSGGFGFRLVAQLAGNSSTTYTDVTPNSGLGAAPLTVSTAYLQKMALSVIPVGGPLVTSRRVYRTPAGSAQLKLLATLTGGTTTFLDIIPDSGLGADAPTVNTATANQAVLTDIPLGAVAVTSRKLYRTAAGGAQLKLLATLADNTTRTYTDSSADAALGVNAPTGDLSGLTQPTGQVLAGSTSLPVASSGAPFVATGGWIRIGSQAVRYTGISGNTLTGIPGPGLPGSLVNTVRYGEHVDAAPVLLGVTGLTQSAVKGISVNIWVERNDTAAQAAMIAIDAEQGRTSDGVYEYLIVDERRAEASLIALCDADLAQFSRPIETVTYATRDLKTKAGKPIVFNLDSPYIHSTLTIQDVTVSEIDLAPDLAPRFTVTASSVRYSLEDMLRQMAASAGV